MAARRLVRGDELLEIPCGRSIDRSQRVLDHVGDAEKRQPSLEERRDCHLVGRVERAGIGAALLSRLPRVREQRKRLQVGRLELERHATGDIERRDRGGAPLWVREGVGDRHTHVRIPEVRKRRTVPEADERMDDRRRVHDDVDLLVREAEQEVSLDQLEAFVRERRRVDGDLRAHVPGRVGQSCSRRHVFQLVARAATKRSARRREHE